MANFFNKGHERTILVKKNVAAAFVVKGISILISLILVPLTINYVNPERNGIWLTLYSMVFWLNLFDIGFGNGMKNKLAEAKANGNIELIKAYISSTYAIVSLICLLVFALFCLINPYLNWIKILSIPTEYSDEISGLIWIAIISFCFTFVLNLLKFILAADQRPSIGAFLDMIGQILILTGIFLLSKTSPASLISLGFVTGFSPVIVYIIASFVLFNRRYKQWKPSFRAINFKLAGNMMNLGIQFFIASCAAFVVTFTLPFLIQKITNPTEVTNYNAAFRLFNLAYSIVGIIVFSAWSSFTDAYTKKDFVWMKSTTARFYKFYVYILIFQVIILLLSPIVYHIWINYWLKETLHISFFMSLSVCIYVSALCWSQISIYPLNGIGKIKLQVYSSIVEMILLIPVSLLLGRIWGAPGVVLAPVIIYIPRMIWAPIQLNKLINNKSSGIWNK